MKRDDWMLFALTFLTGAAIGMYVYIAAFKPIYAPEGLDNTEANAEEWNVVGKRRGGTGENSDIQPSFRVLSDGSYTYLPGGSGDNSLEPVEGSISRSIVRDLQVSESQLNTHTKRVTGLECASDSGGYDYRYRFTINGETYLMDSCQTTLGYDSDLAKALEDVWNVLEGRDSSRSYNNFSDWAEAWIHRTFRE